MHDVSNNYQQQSDLEMSRFFADVDELKQGIVVFEANTAKVEGMQRQMLDSIADPTESTALQREIDSLTARSASMARQLKDNIRSLESRSMRDSTKALQVGALKKMFLDSLQNYHMTESSFRQRLRANVERQLRIIEPDASEAEIRDAVDNGGATQVFSQALLSSDRTGQARSALEEARNRHQEIQRIEQTMKEVALLMEQLMEQVEVQGQELEEIDDKQYEVTEQIETGNVHLGKAKDSARAARKKKWICLAIVVVIIIIIVIALLVKFVGKKSSSN
ncbi:t-SNARE [Myxozyma melibiosi]|uniref:t-SNARE n=1 Tax=Myxozyma melibiosi TaxID=54550 RepID=A0ABR1F6Q7_9ASCO